MMSFYDGYEFRVVSLKVPHLVSTPVASCQLNCQLPFPIARIRIYYM